ncbi:Zinc finger and BTB domain-containing protein 17 [Orchesella cincta]|uniref:Zinc finger and BTB domain-containing protein 17 n=1 Tax=Orchesella cincta TaxID=48709 RepID=A0A1D2NGU0_ORCCI|nr:Zinc finger and BTB domain-containing protein 17 [Orchesella cincta]
MGKVVFEINTKGICLLCLDKSAESRSFDFENKRTAFRMLLRYLKINVLKLGNFPPFFLQALDAVGESSAEVGVTMCGSCAEGTLRFRQLYQEFERIRLQLDEYVRSLYGSMVNGGHQQDRVREYQRHIRSLSGGDLFTASFGESLKKEILQKCAAKVDASTPKITLTKLPSVIGVIVPTYAGSQLPSYTPATLPPTIIELENTIGGKVKPPTAKRSKTKFSNPISTISNVGSAEPEMQTETAMISNDITEDFSKGASIDEIDEASYENAVVKVEIEMGDNESNAEDSVQDVSTLSNDAETSQYTNGQFHNEIESNLSSAKESYSINVGGNTSYDTTTGMFSKAVNPSRASKTRRPYLKNYTRKRKQRIRKFVPCDECGKTVRNDHLPRHKLNHTGEKPYECQYCSRKYRDAFLKLMHVKSTHTMKFYASDLPRGTTLEKVNEAVESILSDDATNSGRRQECPYCYKKLQEGQKSESRTHILHRHFDKVQILLQNQLGHQEGCYPFSEHFMANFPYMQNDAMQVQQSTTTALL